jgi:uroporphyrinogen-III synthase
MKKIYLFSTSSHPDAISINSLDITFLKPDIDFSIYDYFIITSKQTSKALKQYDINSFKDKKALCVSQKTAEAFEKLGGDVLEVGNGYGDSLKSKIKNYPKTTKWLYLRAKEVAGNFANELKIEDYNIDEIVLYESRCSKDILDVKVEDDAVLIFTSPSSVECYLKNKSINEKNTVVVIGQTTAKVLPKNIEYTVSDSKDIESCIQLSQNIIIKI